MAKGSGFGMVGGAMAGGSPNPYWHAIELNFDGDSIITSIDACFTMTAQAFSPVQFNSAAVYVVQGTVDLDFLANAARDPYNPLRWNGAPVDLKTSKWVATWGSFGTGGGVLGAEMSKHFYFGEKGLRLKGKLPWTVLLPAPTIDPATDIYGILSVNGELVEGNDPYGKLR